MYTVVGILGDGIGPEIFECAQQVVAATGVPIKWEIMPAGEQALRDFGTPLPPQTVEAIGKYGSCLKGPLTTPKGGGYRSPNVQLRQHFGLRANVRRVNTFREVPRPLQKPFDIVLVRENVEEFYGGVSETTGEAGSRIAKGAFSVTEAGCRIVAEMAFQHAQVRELKRVHFVHKANILKDLHGLFLLVAKEVAAEYPEIELRDCLGDMFAGDFMRQPEEYSVVLMPNMFGDIFSDLLADLAGGLSFVPGANLGESHAIFEAIHGTAPDRAGTDSANPISLILGAGMLLAYLEEVDAAKLVWHGVHGLTDEWQRWGNGIGVKSTRAVADRIIELMQESIPA